MTTACLVANARAQDRAIWHRRAFPMEAKGWLEDREHVLEEEYFWKKERALVARLRANRRLENEQRALRDALGNADELLAARLQATGVTRDRLDLLFVVPLIEVAWADGDVSIRERQLILERATRRGIVPNTPPYLALTGWLDQCPDNQFFDTASEAVHLMLEREDPDTRADDERDLIASCTRIAEATGEFFGLVRVSHSERECLRRRVPGLCRH